MKYHKKLHFFNKLYFNKIYIFLVLSFTYMAFDIFMKLGNYGVLCTDQKNLHKIPINVWLTLVKHGNNLYEH